MTRKKLNRLKTLGSLWVSPALHKKARHSGARPKAASPEPIFQRPVFMDSGLAAARRPGMTAYLMRFVQNSCERAMIGRLNHVAIVVPDLAAAAAQYREALGAHVSTAHPLPGHGVTVVFVELPNSKIELLEPLGADSPVRGFLDKNPAGGMHHL